VHADAPPFFILHGTDDSVIPVQEGRDFVAALSAVSTAPVITPRSRMRSTPSTFSAPRTGSTPRPRWNAS
jgi:acetyl esterase/lipase